MTRVEPASSQALTVITPYGPATASSRVRVHDWLQFTGFGAEIIDYAGLPNHSGRMLARNASAVLRAEVRQRRLTTGKFDRLLIHKEVTPFSSGGLAEKLLQRAQIGVYDLDDAVMWTHRGENPSRWTPGGVARRVWSKAESPVRSAQAADRVIAGSEVLAAWAAKYNPDVRMIPSCVDPARYRAKEDYAITSEQPRLVWLGSPATERHLQLLAQPLLDVHAALGARLTVISSGQGDLGPLSPMVDRREWDPTVERWLADFDVALAPLIESPYSEAKCAYKLVQYGAAGLPSVASPVGANIYTSIDLGQAVAATTTDWRDTLMDILSATASARAVLGATARQGVERRYSFAAWAQRWRDAVGM